MNLHPDDILLFHEVAAAMRRVAKQYGLPLVSVEPHPDPAYATAARGYCTADGRIFIALRGQVDGTWDAEPRRDEDVWQTAAHELAHLKHFNHGAGFQEFEQEMCAAMRNQHQDHREKVLARLVKMQRARDGERALGNVAAAEAFAEAINRMLIEHELHPSDIDYARTCDDDPVIELPVAMDAYGIEQMRCRIAWQETLARIVARAHLCTFLVQRGSNAIIFVGTRSHATVAEYVYGTLLPCVKRMAWSDYRVHARLHGTQASKGFVGAWTAAFVSRIAERFESARQAAVAKHVPVDVPGAQSTALLRLDGQLVKVKQYIDHKFAKKSRYASALYAHYSRHDGGSAMGRAAADKVTIGRKGVTGGRAPKLLS